MNSAWVCVYFPERGYGYLRDSLTGVQIFFHRCDFIGDPATIVEKARVHYDVVHYNDRKNQPRTKAVHVQLAPTSNPGGGNDK